MARKPSKGKSESFYQTVKRLGATEFCKLCHAYVVPEHSVHWPTAEFKPTTVTLEGGLDS